MHQHTAAQCGIVLLMESTTDAKQTQGRDTGATDGLRDDAVLPPAGKYERFSGGASSSPIWDRYEFQPFRPTWEYEVSSPKLRSIIEAE